MIFFFKSSPIISDTLIPSAKTPTEDIINFYLGKTKNKEGKTINQIWGMNFRNTKNIEHRFIEYLFPKLTKEDIEKFKTDTTLKNNVLFSLQTTLRFCGLFISSDSSKSIKKLINQNEPCDNFDWRIEYWIYPKSPWIDKMIDVLNFLCLTDNKIYAKALMECLHSIYNDHNVKIKNLSPNQIISSETYESWKNTLVNFKVIWNSSPVSNAVKTLIKCPRMSTRVNKFEEFT